MVLLIMREQEFQLIIKVTYDAYMIGVSFTNIMKYKEVEMLQNREIKEGIKEETKEDIVVIKAESITNKIFINCCRQFFLSKNKSPAYKQGIYQEEEYKEIQYQTVSQQNIDEVAKYLESVKIQNNLYQSSQEEVKACSNNQNIENKPYQEKYSYLLAFK